MLALAARGGRTSWRPDHLDGNLRELPNFRDHHHAVPHVGITVGQLGRPQANDWFHEGVETNIIRILTDLPGTPLWLLKQKMIHKYGTHKATTWEL